MKRWESLCDGYIRQCEAQGLAPSTIYMRQAQLGRLGVWLRKRRPRPALEAIDGPLLVEYLRARTAFQSKSTLAGALSVLRCFGEYLVAEGVWVKSPLRWMKGPKLDPRRLLPRRVSQEQLLAVFKEAAQSREEYQRYLMLAVLSVLYATGLRRGELERLTLGSYDMANATLRIDGRKTGQERVVPLSQSAVQCVEAYLPQRFNVLCKRGNTAERALFVGKTGRPLTGERIGLCVGRLAKRAQVPEVTLHQFRHSCASDLLEEGVGIAEVQRILGHAVIVTTFRYTQIADPMRRQSVSLHPINEILADLTEVFHV